MKLNRLLLTTALAAFILASCSTKKYTMKKAGADSVKKIAIVSLYHNSNFKRAGEGGGGSIMSLGKNMFSSDKENQKSAVTIPESVTTMLYHSHENAFKNSGHWKVVPYKQLIKTKAYQSFVKKYKGKVSMKSKNPGWVNALNDNYVSSYKNLLALEQIDKKVSAQLAKDLNVDGVIVIESSVGWTMTTGIGGMGRAKVVVDSEIYGINKNNQKFLETFEGAVAAAGDDGFGVVSGETVLNTKKVKFVKRAVVKSAKHLEKRLKTDFKSI